MTAQSCPITPLCYFRGGRRENKQTENVFISERWRWLHFVARKKEKCEEIFRIAETSSVSRLIKICYFHSFLCMDRQKVWRPEFAAIGKNRCFDPAAICESRASQECANNNSQWTHRRLEGCQVRKQHEWKWKSNYEIHFPSLWPLFFCLLTVKNSLSAITFRLSKSPMNYPLHSLS